MSHIFEKSTVSAIES